MCDAINSSFLHAVWLRPITIFQGFFKLSGVGVGAGGQWVVKGTFCGKNEA